jgi:valyl-tRNA synthetase
MLETHSLLLQTLARIESIEILEEEAEAPPAATALLGSTKLLVPMAGLIDVEAERSRLRKQQDKLAVERGRAAQKLQNESFVDRAPADVVAKERQRLKELEGALSELNERLQKLDTLRAASTD